MEKQLKSGTILDFDNSLWCELNQSEDIMFGHIQWDNTFGFGIFFNGKCIHSSKTFKSMNNRLIKLMDKWRCEFIKD